MKLNSIRKIALEDYPEEIRSWFVKLTYTLNPFLEQVYSIAVNGITLADNLKAQTFKLTILAGETTKSVSWTLNERPTSVHLGQILKADGNHPDNSITMTWTYINGQIKCKFFNLDSSTKYQITIIGQV